MWVFVVVVVAVIGGVAVVAAGHGGSMAQVSEDRPDVVVQAERSLSSEDLRTVRFTVGVRGYRMDEVDSLLSRLAEELADREAGNALTPRAPTPQPGPNLTSGAS